MSEKVSRQDSTITQESPQIALLREAFPEYWATVSAMHLVQSTVARKLKALIDSHAEKIKTSCMLEKAPAEASRSIYPDFPSDTYEYQAADIGAHTWLDSPQDALLWVFLHFPRPDHSENAKVNLVAAWNGA